MSEASWHHAAGDDVPDDDELRALLGDDIASSFESLAVDGHGVLRDLSDQRPRRHLPPEPIKLVHVLDVPSVFGARVIYMRQAGPEHNLRAASDVFTDDGGGWVKVVEEWRWFAWLAMLPGTRPPVCPRATAIAVPNLWVDPTSIGFLEGLPQGQKPPA